jgi:hypothetical protein
MKSNYSTVLSVIALLLLFAVIMLISITATTEADEGLPLTNSQENSMEEYYRKCPFKKAELEDLSREKSIREYVKFIDVSCDETRAVENVRVQLLGDKKASLERFTGWLNTHQLQQSDRLFITIEN